MVNFNIVEGDDILDRIGDDFIRMYDKGISRTIMCKQLEISKTQF